MLRFKSLLVLIVFIVVGKLDGYAQNAARTTADFTKEFGSQPRVSGEQLVEIARRDIVAMRDGNDLFVAAIFLQTAGDLSNKCDLLMLLLGTCQSF